MIFFDTETIGLHGLAVLIQWARDGGPVKLHHVFDEPVHKTVHLIDSIAREADGVVGFNLAFDWFHLQKLRTVLCQLNPTLPPIEQLYRLRFVEPLGRDLGCLKPVTACDLLVQASEGKHQAVMLEHNELRIRSIPNYMSHWVADLLNQELKFPDIFFARRKDPSVRFQALPKSRKGFDDIVLKFAPKQDLKSLVSHILKVPTTQFKELSPPPFPADRGYAPFSDWDDKDIIDHSLFWRKNEEARRYAEHDVVWTRDLYDAFGRPALGDVNSLLACMIGSVRWRGFTCDMDKVLHYAAKCQSIMDLAPRDPRKAREYIQEVMDAEERDKIRVSTKKQVLHDLIECYEGEEVGARAQKVLRARQAKYNYDMCRKLTAAGRFHASASVIGTLSGRKSGSGGDFNSQGISKNKHVRSLFTFARDDEVLCGGDFQSFEVAIADGFFQDPKLHEDLVTGKSVHAIFGTYLFPGHSYDQIVASSGTSNDMYKKAKSALFLTLYGGQPETYTRNLNIPIAHAKAGFDRFCERYQVISQKRQQIFADYEMLSQPDGPGTPVDLAEPKKKHVESLLGFRRSFEPEFDVIRLLYELSENLPRDTYRFDHKYPPLVRNKRKQRPSSALRSALYAAAFGIQGSIQRAANNHVIQSTGAGICKEMELAIWALQPPGYHPWKVAPLNLHDEVMVACQPEVVPALESTVNSVIESRKDIVPLLAIDWKNNLSSWAD